MKAFWWFKDNEIAGMARPGFNSALWLALPFDEATVLGWIGQHSSGPIDLETFRHHLQTRVPRTYKYHGLDAESGPRAIAHLHTAEGLAQTIDRLAKSLGIIKGFSLGTDHLQIEFCSDRLADEIEMLKSHGIRRIVALTEKHHNRDRLAEHFDLHHISIEDLGAPDLEQVRLLVDVIQEARKDGARLAVHCLAGIGRTSTMLMAAHLFMGESYDGLAQRLRERNPSYSLTGPQGEFIEKVRQSLRPS